MILKKNKRKIIVDGKEYWWQVHYEKDPVRPHIFISSDENKLLLKQPYDKETIVSGRTIEQLIKDHNLWTDFFIIFSRNISDLEQLLRSSREYAYVLE